MAFARKEGLKIRIRHADIEKRVRHVARKITKDFKGQRVHLIGVLKGACFFLADLAREIDLETSIDFIAVASYGKTKESSGQVRMLKDLDNNVAGLNVILVEDILDTGLTANYLLRILRQRRPKTLRLAALLDKPSRRLKPVKATISDSPFPTNSSSATDSITPNATAISKTSAFCILLLDRIFIEALQYASRAPTARLL